MDSIWRGRSDILFHKLYREKTSNLKINEGSNNHVLAGHARRMHTTPKGGFREKKQVHRTVPTSGFRF